MTKVRPMIVSSPAFGKYLEVKERLIEINYIREVRSVMYKFGKCRRQEEKGSTEDEMVG